MSSESPRFLAAREGKRKYQGKPCKTCGSTERYVINAGCVACTMAAKNKEHQAIKALLQQAETDREVA